MPANQIIKRQASVAMSKPEPPKKRKTMTKNEITKLVKNEVMKSMETKWLYDPLASSGDGITDLSKAFTCFRIQRGERQYERIGSQVTPVGLRLDYAFANQGTFNAIRIKMLVVELAPGRAINAGNAGSYILDNIFKGENSAATQAVDSTALLQAERLTAPLNTDLFDVLYEETFELGKANAVGVRDAHACGTKYVKLKKQTPITYNNTTSTRPGDPDLSRNIVVLYFGASPDIRATVGNGAYAARVNIRQYYKDN